MKHKMIGSQSKVILQNVEDQAAILHEIVDRIMLDTHTDGNGNQLITYSNICSLVFNYWLCAKYYLIYVGDEDYDRSTHPLESVEKLLIFTANWIDKVGFPIQEIKKFEAILFPQGNPVNLSITPALDEKGQLNPAPNPSADGAHRGYVFLIQ